MQATRCLVVDSGTTNTRVRLSDGRRILATASAAVGARTTAAEGNNRGLRRELGKLLRQVLEQNGLTLADIDALVASGMITSNLGLLEVPHLAAPTGPDELGRAIVKASFPDICERPIHFIPGVKTLPGEAAGVVAGDLLRGEEAEVTGLRILLGLNGPVTFLHYGSHHKAVRTDAAGRILSSETTMTGELLQAVSEHTILSTTVVPARTVTLDDGAWLSGLEMAEVDGIGRALFVARLTQQLLGQSPQQSTNFLLGALTTLDLPMVRRAIDRGDRLVLYGGDQFPSILVRYLELVGRGQGITLVSKEIAELAAVVGAIAIYERHAGGHVA